MLSLIEGVSTTLKEWTRFWLLAVGAALSFTGRAEESSSAHPALIGTLTNAAQVRKGVSLQAASIGYVRLRFHWKDQTLNIVIKDNGCGFNDAEVASENGLLNMRHHLEKIGGRFEIDSRTNSGTICRIWLPCI
jgi:LytS/YehU family sensor histidine kinase